MKAKLRTVKTNVTGDLTETEVSRWIGANKRRVNADVVQARASLRKGEGKKWDMAAFLARAQKRQKAKKKKK